MTRGSRYVSLKTKNLKSKLSRGCFAYRGSSVWNSLSSEVKSSRTFKSLQRKLIAILMEKS